MESYNMIFGVPPEYLTAPTPGMEAGSLDLERGTVVVGAMIASSFYNPRQRPGLEPPPPPDLMGEILSLALSRWTNDGREIRRTVQVRVGGGIAEMRGEADWSIYMTLDEVTALNPWVSAPGLGRS